MPKQGSLKLDHKEIAVIFSLFVFIALLMFTVGILVGKGLTIAKYEREGFPETSNRNPAGLATHPSLDGGSSGMRLGGNPSNDTSDVDERLKLPEDVLEAEAPKKPEPLELIPKKKARRSPLGDSLLESNRGLKKSGVLKNPKVQALLEGGHSGSRKPNSLTVPSSFPSGQYTVQIGSYPNRRDAEARVDSLKKLGFAHAYISAKQLGERRQTWFRVWLGYFPDFNSAKSNAEYLQKKGEVKNYLVRKATKNTG